VKSFLYPCAHLIRRAVPANRCPAGSSLERVLRVHVVLADISHMAEMDRVYREFFPVDPPARTAWSMQLRFGNGCEIECVALAG